MFHLYGLIIGIAVCVSWFLIEKKLAQFHIPERDLFWLVVLVFFGAVVGARAYHVMTDFSVYMNDPLRALQIWRGGLSIIGAVMGAIFGMMIFLQWKKDVPVSLMALLDAATFGLPFGQAIGRLGNLVNQELYGLPSHLPWAIYIDPAHRFASYQNDAYYHPLFAYEMVAMIFLGVIFWLLENKKSKFFRIGTGNFFLIYLLWYSFVRFLLDFIRIDKAPFLTTGLGINQVVMIGIFLSAGFLLGKKMQKSFFLIFILLLTAAAVYVMWSHRSSDFKDHQHTQLSIHGKTVTVEVVNTPASMEQGLSDRDAIGSDGMLFLFPQKKVLTFWMKDMKFNLDMIWLDDWKVVDVTKNIPQPTAQQRINPNSLPIYSPAVPANMVIEVTAGDADKWGVQAGDVVQKIKL